ncbi:MAG: LemA family protein [Bacteroidetes bacterium]|nr:LemA family protein [Bacteroidota bacterium]
MTWIIYVAIVALLLLYGVAQYNKLVRMRSMVEEGWSGIDVQLKKRYNLIPNLVETVKGYAKHEKDTFQKITEARNMAQQASGVKEQQAAENQLNKSLVNLFAVAEQYPDLKSNTNFLQLQQQLSEIESDIEKSRRYYNGTVRDKNIAVQSFPSNIVANMFGFHESAFFELDDISQKDLPEVKF